MHGIRLTVAVMVRELRSLPAVQAIGGRGSGLVREVPPGTALPAFLVYKVASLYPDPPLGVAPSMEQVWIVVKFVCEGTSITPIEAAHQAQFEHFSSFEYPIDEVVDDVHYQLSFVPETEIPDDEIILLPNAQFWSQVGTMYRVEITRGG